ncbi:hypothetical protein DRQ26_00665 [bacterium]|nr:MAG: hypothetical protein DRQ26_00665 [bacterium]
MIEKIRDSAEQFSIITFILMSFSTIGLLFRNKFTIWLFFTFLFSSVIFFIIYTITELMAYNRKEINISGGEN